MRVLSVHGVLPEHRYEQAEITEVFTRTMLRGKVDEKVVGRLHGNAGVRTRHLVLPIERYAELADFGESNDRFIEAGVELGARAVTDALKAVGLTPEDVDVLVSATVTGLDLKGTGRVEVILTPGTTAPQSVKAVSSQQESPDGFQVWVYRSTSSNTSVNWLALRQV